MADEEGARRRRRSAGYVGGGMEEKRVRPASLSNEFSRYTRDVGKTEKYERILP